RKGRYLDTETEPRCENDIDSIRVTSNMPFSAMYPAGASLNALFLIFNNSYLNTSSLDNPHITNIYSEEFYDKPFPDHVDLLLMVPPDTVLSHTFTVRVKLSDGTVYTDTTTPVVLF
ncbi:MAG: hypothetical protein ACHQF2_04795, partial [Flavobacteriales bacterium]